jgi:putative aldouronate transport system substrate-binding protein
MRKIRLVFALLLVMTLPLACIGGCASSPAAPAASVPAATQGTTDTGPAATEGPVQKVVYYMPSFNRIPDDYKQINDAINNYIKTNFPGLNIDFEEKLIGIADYQTKVNLAMQSGEQMDIFVPLGIQQFIAKNQCLAIEDLLQQYGQDVNKKVMEEIGEKAYAPFTKDGHIYGVPINKSMVITPTLIYDEDIMKATGMNIDDVKTVRDLEPVFEKVKELYPDVYPFSALNMQDSMILLILKNEQNMDYLNDNALSATAWMGVVFGNDNQVVNPFETQIFKDYVGLIRDWFLKGYLPKDMATSTATSTELFAANRLFCTWGGYGGKPTGKAMSSMAGMQGRNIDAKWIAPFYMTTADAGLCTSISSTSKSPEGAMKFINLVYTDEFVINTLLLGIKDVDYVMVDEHRWKYPDGLDQNTVSYTNYITTGVLGSESIQYIPDSMSWDDALFKFGQNKTANFSPYFGFVFDPANVTNELTALQNVYTQYMPGLVCGSLDPDTTIPEMLKAMKDAGIDKVIAEKQAQLDAWLAANK